MEHLSAAWGPEAGVDDFPADVGPDDDVHGDPVAAFEWTQVQTADGLCAVASVGMVASRLTEQPVGEDEVVRIATDLGLLEADDPDGMTLHQTGALLEHLGIGAEVAHGTLDDLRQYLDEGRGIILAVDADELGRADDDGSDGGVDANHALVITGIDDSRQVVAVNDPGRPAAPAVELPVETLLDAWDDADNGMVVTDAGAVPVAVASPGPIVLDDDGLDPVAVAGYVLLPVSLGTAVAGRRRSRTAPPDH